MYPWQPSSGLPHAPREYTGGPAPGPAGARTHCSACEGETAHPSPLTSPKPPLFRVEHGPTGRAEPRPSSLLHSSPTSDGRLCRNPLQGGQRDATLRELQVSAQPPTGWGGVGRKDPPPHPTSPLALALLSRLSCPVLSVNVCRFATVHVRTWIFVFFYLLFLT